MSQDIMSTEYIITALIGMSVLLVIYAVFKCRKRITATKNAYHVAEKKIATERTSHNATTESNHQEPIEKYVNLKNIITEEVTKDSDNEESAEEDYEFINEKMEEDTGRSINMDARDNAIDMDNKNMEAINIDVEPINKEAKDSALYLYIKKMKDFCQSGKFIIEETLKDHHCKFMQEALNHFVEKVQDKLNENYNVILKQEIEARYGEILARNQKFYETEQDKMETKKETAVNECFDFYKNCMSKACDPDGRIFMSPEDLDIKHKEFLDEARHKFNFISKMDAETNKKCLDNLCKKIEINLKKINKQNDQIIDYLHKMKDNNETVKQLKQDENVKTKELKRLEERNKKSRKEKNDDVLTQIETLKKELEIIKGEQIGLENENKEFKNAIEKKIRDRYSKDIADIMLDFDVVRSSSSPGNSSNPSGFVAKFNTLKKTASLKTVIVRNVSFKAKFDKLKNFTKRKSFHEEHKSSDDITEL